jgi:hypothetical protein
MFIPRITLPLLGFYHAPKAHCTKISLYNSNGAFSGNRSNITQLLLTDTLCIQPYRIAYRVGSMADTNQCLRLKTCIFAVPSFFLDSEIKTTKLFIYTCFHNVLCLVLFLNRKEKTFSKQDHSHFYRTLTATSFSDERFNLNRVRSLRKRRNTKSNINRRFLRRRP